MEEKDFEITNVVVRRYHKIQFLNGRPLPGYSSLYGVYVHYKHNGTNWRWRFYSIQPDPIDIECSVRDYYKMLAEGLTEEIYGECETYEKLREYMHMQHEIINNFTNS